MSISTKLYSEQTLTSLTRLDGKITGLQDQVASGRKDVRPSTDVAAAVQLSAAREMLSDVARYRDNLASATNRMSVADGALSSVSNILIRAKELGLQGANDTLSPLDRRALALEMSLLKEALVGLANTRDGNNQAVFGGYQTREVPFVLAEDGSVAYSGDAGQTALRVGPDDMLATAVSGQDVLMRIPTQNGPKSAFEILDEMANILQMDHLSETEVKIASRGGAVINVETPRTPLTHRFSLTGPLGTAEVSADVVRGVDAPLIDAINAVSDQTGVVAVRGDAPGQIYIAAENGGEMRLSAYQVEGQTGVEQRGSYGMNLQEVDMNRLPLEDRPAVRFADQDQSFDGALAALGGAIDHVAINHARLGAYMAQAERQDDIMAKREVLVQQSKSDLEDADLAELVTQIQSMIVNRDATRQLFSKTISQSLFDFIR